MTVDKIANLRREIEAERLRNEQVYKNADISTSLTPQARFYNKQYNSFSVASKAKDVSPRAAMDEIIEVEED